MVSSPCTCFPLDALNTLSRCCGSSLGHLQVSADSWTVFYGTLLTLSALLTTPHFLNTVNREKRNRNHSLQNWTTTQKAEKPYQTMVHHTKNLSSNCLNISSFRPLCFKIRPENRPNWFNSNFSSTHTFQRKDHWPFQQLTWFTKPNQSLLSPCSLTFALKPPCGWPQPPEPCKVPFPNSWPFCESCRCSTPLLSKLMNPVLYDRQASPAIFEWRFSNSVGTNLVVCPFQCGSCLPVTQHLLPLFSYFMPPALNLLNHSRISEQSMFFHPSGFATSAPSAALLFPPHFPHWLSFFTLPRWPFLWELFTDPCVWGGEPSAGLL